MRAFLPLACVAIGASAPAAVPASALKPLHPADTRALTGELRCGFSVAGRTLMLAAADAGRTAPRHAVVRTRAAVMLAGWRGGALERGGTFGGGGLRVRVERGARLATGTEELRYRAALAVARDGGGERRYAGVWSCGP